MIIIESERLYLRTLSYADIDDLYTLIFSEKEVLKHTFGHALTNLAQVTEFLAESGNFNGVFGLSALVERNSGQLIGLAGVLESRHLTELDYEFGFILAKKYWGKGYAKEIGQAQIDFIGEQLNVSRVLAFVNQSNLASIKTIKRLGLEYLTTISLADRGEREVYVLNYHATKAPASR